MSLTYDTPQYAPKNYAEMEPCVDISDQQTGNWKYTEYAGSGIDINDHPFIKGNIFHYWDITSNCGECTGKNTLSIYLSYVSGSSGKDMTIELLCRDCGKYSVDIYSD